MRLALGVMRFCFPSPALHALCALRFAICFALRYALCSFVCQKALDLPLARGDNGPAHFEVAASLKLIDTHAHLDEIEDIAGALDRARAAGVLAVVAVGTDLASNEKILDLSRSYPGFVFPALGLHPWKLQGDLEPNFSLIARELPSCVAMGEVGLDYALDIPREEQREVLRRLLEIARGDEKPVLLHARRAWGETLEMVKASGVRRAVFHWYSGPPALLPDIFARGYYISATPAAAYSERHRRAVQAAPLAQLLLETDAPEVYRGQSSEPADLLAVLDAVSEVKGTPREEVARLTSQNALDFFQLKLPGEAP